MILIVIVIYSGNSNSNIVIVIIIIIIGSIHCAQLIASYHIIIPKKVTAHCSK